MLRKFAINSGRKCELIAVVVLSSLIYSVKKIDRGKKIIYGLLNQDNSSLIFSFFSIAFFEE